ncbi:MAG: ABC-2 family transporter protein [Chloroflexaceae bacterium]|jgi:ABC-2 type transport system permease protein|nr:ABC-2 family transporter protein [Chloroflexaceae bacterium]
MHIFKLLSTFFKVNVQQELAYRADAVVNMLMSLMWLGWELLSLSIIFSNTATLGGWGPGELVTLLGVWRLVNTLMAALIWPNTEKFNNSVRDGSLDYTLLQPVSSLFLISFGRMVVWRLFDVLLALGLIIGGLTMSGGSATPLQLASFMLLTISGMMIIYSLWIVLIAVTFWFVKFDNNVTILQALMDAGRYPATVYPFWLRMLITFVIPIAVATTVPLQALRGDLAPWQTLLFLGVSAVSLLVAMQFWRFGIRRYSGASS